MKFGDMKIDVPFEGIVERSENFGFITKYRIAMEGKRLLEKHPEYKYLKEDPTLKAKNDFYCSVTYAYMVDQILKENPEFNPCYKEMTSKGYEVNTVDGAKKRYLYSNYDFLWKCVDLFTEKQHPGTLAWRAKRRAQEKQARDRQMLEMEIAYEAKHPHVTCPYCKSTNTEKISTVSRAVSVSLVGAASGKIGKQWHCNNCKSDF